MRGSVYYQSAELTKAIFCEGIKKEERIDPSSPYFGYISSYKTMETYRKVWDNFGNYLRELWKVKDFEEVIEEHVTAYMLYKLEYYPSKQYLEKISSALGKLELALTFYTKNKYGNPKQYDFGIRQKKLDYARSLGLVADGYHNRVYAEPQKIIENLSKNEHKIAASIQLQGGARSEGVLLIKKEQLKGCRVDSITKRDVGVIETKEKGGKVGDVLISTSLYSELEAYFKEKKIFKVCYSTYSNDIKNVCLKLGIKPEGSHGFRWSFAQNRVRGYQKCGYTFEEALQGVSYEMKHFRASITEHYLGGSINFSV